MGFDAGELRQVAADLAKGVDLADVEKVVSKGALNVKTQLRAEASKSRHFRLSRHITYDMRGYTEAEIGPEARGAGSLAGIAYFGGRHGGGGTLPDPQGALDAEAPRFAEELGKLGEAIL